MSYDKLKTSELNTPAQTEEELDVIEMLAQQFALGISGN